MRITVSKFKGSDCSKEGHITCAAQKVGRLLDAAMRIRPKVAKPSIRRKPSARPQTSSIFAIGIYTADVMALATISITVNRE